MNSMSGNNESKKRRFIAGATCPNCERQDTLFVYADALNDILSCAACDYTEGPPEPKSQVKPEFNGVETVKFVDATKVNGD